MLRILLLLFICNAVNAQVTSSGPDPFYLVYFKDKALHNSIDSMPPLSSRSLERRVKQCIALSESDYPVSGKYVKKIIQCEIKIMAESRWLNAVVINATVVQLSELLILPFVKNIYPLVNHGCKNAEVRSIPDMGLYSSDEQIKMLGLHHMHASGFTGKGKLIAVFDNGFSNVNKLNAYQIIFKEKRMVATRNFVNPGLSVFETGSDGEHGARVFSLLAALMPPNFIGAAYDASFALAVSEDVSKEGLLEEINWLLAAEWADSLGADIISSSLGYATKFTYGSDHTYAEMDGKTTIVSKAATFAASKGILVVNAAGNDGSNPWMYISAPADADSCLAVGAVNVNGIYAGFSSIGPTFDERVKPDIAAMGAGTVTLSPAGYLRPGNGTSFACPLIAGFAACLWQTNNSVRNMELFNIIKESGNNAIYPDFHTGWGIPSAVIAYKNLNKTDLPQSLPVLDNILTIIPNPVSQNFLIRFYFMGEPTNGEIIFYNGLAEQIEKHTVKLHTGNNYFSFSRHDLQLVKGLYMVQLIGVNQPLSIKNKILVQD
ncbi:MAG: S8 family serine peptidase [Bacteroidia bacterium]|nr:S8 family serine peptidase [Bacteroidia bacterium]